MFASSIPGGSICIGCQLRAVTRRAAAPIVAAATQTQIQSGRRQHYASRATKPKEDAFTAILNDQRHQETKASLKEIPSQDWGLDGDWGISQDTPKNIPKDTPRDTHKNTPQDTYQDVTAGTLEDGWEETGEKTWRADESQTSTRKPRSKIHTNKEQEKLVPIQPAPRSYRKGSTRLVENFSKLSVDTLGQAAEVIVLREDGSWIKKYTFREEENATEGGLALEDLVDQDDGLSLELVMENIDELRPQHQILPAGEFKSVFDMVMKGFTAVQIEGYVARYHRRIEEGDETPFLGAVPGTVKPHSWIISQSQWVPEVKGAVAGVGYPLAGYILKSMPPKQRLVMQLMRECWGMSVQELNHGSGAVEVRIRDLEFKLLTMGTQRWLQNISRIYLSQGKGKAIEVVKSRNLVRIMAPMVVAESCLDAIGKTLEKIRTKTFNLDKISIQGLDAKVAEQLGKITNSVIEINHLRKEITVTWIDPRNESASQLEDLSDTVFRLLLTGSPPSNIMRTLSSHPRISDDGKLIEVMTPNEKLSWMDRRMKWARLCLPLTSEEFQASKEWPLKNSVLKYEVRPMLKDFVLLESVLPSKIRESTTARYAVVSATDSVPVGIPKPRKASQSEGEDDQIPLKPILATPSGWFPPTTRTNAVFGHILHLNKAELAESLGHGPGALATSPRIMSPLIPPVAKMALPSWVPYRTPSNMVSMVLMRFVPYSEQPSTQLKSAPSLELRMKASNEDIIEIDSLRAIAHTHVSDILLPSGHIDVRVTERLEANLPGSDIGSTEGMGPLLTFLRNSYLEIREGRLVTPPRIADLGLPQWMFYDKHHSDPASEFLPSGERKRLEEREALMKSKSDDKTATEPEPKSEDPPFATQLYAEAFNTLVPTSYVFAGLEVHRTLETTYDGWKMVYTSIEAGQGGGRRAELSLEAVPSRDTELRRSHDKIGTHEFLRSVYALATGREDNPTKQQSDGDKVQSTIGWLGKAAEKEASEKEALSS